MREVGVGGLGAPDIALDWAGSALSGPSAPFRARSRMGVHLCGGNALPRRR